MPATGRSVWASASESTTVVSATLSICHMMSLCTIAVCALIVYDYVISLPKEIRHFWKRGATGPKLLFFSNRYALLTYAVLFLVNTSRFIDTVCLIINVAINLCLITLCAIQSVFATLRVFALSGRSKTITSLVLCLSSATIWSNIYLCSRTTYLLERYNGTIVCSHTLDISFRSLYMCIILKDVSSVCADLIVLLITWSRAWGIRRAVGSSGASMPVVDTLLRDGTIYFISVSILNIVQITTLMLYSKIDYTSCLLVPLPSVFLSRFLLNLHSSAGSSRSTLSELDSQTDSMESLQFEDQSLKSTIA